MEHAHGGGRLAKLEPQAAQVLGQVDRHLRLVAALLVLRGVHVDDLVLAVASAVIS